MKATTKKIVSGLSILLILLAIGGGIYYLTRTNKHPTPPTPPGPSPSPGPGPGPGPGPTPVCKLDTDCKQDQKCSSGICVCDPSKCKTGEVCYENVCRIPPTPGKVCDDPGRTCLSPWGTNFTGDDPKLQPWIQSVIDEQAIWYPKTNQMYGIKTGPPPAPGQPVDPSAPQGIGSICPYGTYFDGLDGKDVSLTGVIGSTDSPCIDYIPSNCASGKSVMNQCNDVSEDVTPPNPLPRIFMTWFEIPTGITEAGAQDYVDLVLSFCKATQTKDPTKSTGITGLCYPMVTWPDGNNMTWLLPPGQKEFASTNANRQLYGKWIVDNFITPCSKYTVNPGLLLYTNFKDGPWGGSKSGSSLAPGFYSDNFAGLTNPITNVLFTAPPDQTSWSGGVTSLGGCPDTDKRCAQWVWGAIIHFMNNYIIAQSTDPATLTKEIWFHLDKEGCSCGLPSDYIGWVESLIGNVFDPASGVTPPINFKATPSDYDTRLFLATGLGTPGESAEYNNTTYNSISVPENYWYAGNQMPCGGDPGSYLYARTGCTSMTSHRRLQDRPVSYYNLIAGQQGSDCCPNWLGDAKWQTETDQLKAGASSKQAGDLVGPKFVWPSFSIENISLCDKDDPTCYSQYVKQGATLDNPAYSNPLTNNTTICANMMFGTDPANPKIPPSQGTRACGVFDGFSFWTWDGMIDWLNEFSNQTGAQNLIIYEASFIPYHWFNELGLMANGSLYASGVTGTTRMLKGLPAPTTEEICSSDSDCTKTNLNGICLDSYGAPVVSGGYGVCADLCLVAPTGLKNMNTDNTVWVQSASTDVATTTCSTYYTTPGGNVVGVKAPGSGSVTPQTYTNPFKSPCTGSIEGHLAGGTSNIYACQYHPPK